MLCTSYMQHLNRIDGTNPAHPLYTPNLKHQNSAHQLCIDKCLKNQVLEITYSANDYAVPLQAREMTRRNTFMGGEISFRLSAIRLAPLNHVPVFRSLGIIKVHVPWNSRHVRTLLAFRRAPRDCAGSVFSASHFHYLPFVSQRPGGTCAPKARLTFTPRHGHYDPSGRRKEYMYCSPAPGRTWRMRR